MFRRYSRNGVWDRIHAFLVDRKAETEVVMVDSTHVNAHRTSASMAAGVGSERDIGRSRGGLTTKIHTLSDANERPIFTHLTGGNSSDNDGYKGLRGRIGPETKCLVGDRCYDAD